MVYTDIWDITFEGDPEDSDDIGQGAERIRDLKLAVRERLAKDHYLEIAGTDADHGEHNKVTLREQASNPASAANKGFVYSKDVAGVTELFYEDSAGNTIQLTSGGAINLTTGEFTTGTKAYFYQDTAPTGWTYDSAVTDRCLAVKGGTAAFNVAGGNQAGAWTHTHTQSHTHAFTTSGHTHSVSTTMTNGSYEGSLAFGGRLVVSGSALYASQAGGSAYYWATTGATGTAASATASGTTGAASAATDANTTFRPYSAVGIIATKN